MDNESALNLWKDCNWEGMPLESNIISESEDSLAKHTYLYFNGIAATDGCCRIYACISVPKNVVKPPVVLLTDDIAKPLEEIDIIPLLAMGYAVMRIDLGGKDSHKQRFTIYPPSLGFADYLGNGFVKEDGATSTKEDMSKHGYSDNPKQTCWYVWTASFLRAVTFLVSLDYIDTKKIALIARGSSTPGGWGTLALDHRIACGTIMWDNGEFDTIDGKEVSKAYANENYAAHLLCPLLLVLASNEINGSLDKMSEIISKIDTTTILSISERSNHSVGLTQKDNVKYWLEHNLRGGDYIPRNPSLAVKASGGKLYLKLNPDTHLNIDKVEFFYSSSATIPQFRNWYNVASYLVDGDYMATIPVYNATTPIFVFANIKYENSFSVSSSLQAKVPATLGVNGSEVMHQHLVYDTDMGLDCWTIISKDREAQQSLQLEKGSFDILGITSSCNEVTTFKIGDSQYRGHSEDLQFNFFSAVPQTITIIAISSGDKSRYYTVEAKLKATSWEKYSASAQSFKSACGTLVDWSEIVGISITSTSKLLINSMLWV